MLSKLRPMNSSDIDIFIESWASTCSLSRRRRGQHTPLFNLSFSHFVSHLPTFRSQFHLLCACFFVLQFLLLGQLFSRRRSQQWVYSKTHKLTAMDNRAVKRNNTRACIASFYYCYNKLCANSDRSNAVFRRFTRQFTQLPLKIGASKYINSGQVQTFNQVSFVGQFK